MIRARLHAATPGPYSSSSIDGLDVRSTDQSHETRSNRVSIGDPRSGKRTAYDWGWGAITGTQAGGRSFLGHGLEPRLENYAASTPRILQLGAPAIKQKTARGRRCVGGSVASSVPAPARQSTVVVVRWRADF